LPAAEDQLPLMSAYTAPTVTPVAALAIANVWAAVRVLADAASSLPLHVYRKTDSGRERVTSGKLVELLGRPAGCRATRLHARARGGLGFSRGYR
jgi:phage portal protein BeeE